MLPVYESLTVSLDASHLWPKMILILQIFTKFIVHSTVVQIVSTQNPRSWILYKVDQNKAAKLVHTWQLSWGKRHNFEHRCQVSVERKKLVMLSWYEKVDSDINNSISLNVVCRCLRIAIDLVQWKLKLFSAQISGLGFMVI